MKLILTSFGIELMNPESDFVPFHLVPPVAARGPDGLLEPDYAALLLCQELVMDEQAFSALQRKSTFLYSKVAETFEVLRSHGFITLTNFRAILRENEQLLNKMLEHDLMIPEHWLAPLRESYSIWINLRQRLIGGNRSTRDNRHNLDIGTLELFVMLFLRRFRSLPYSRSFHNTIDVDRIFSGKRMHLDATDRRTLRKILPAYLSHVNANIVISNELGLGFHDWADFLPLYKEKFLSVGRIDIGAEQHIEASHKLFEVAFPEFAITDVRTLVRLLTDKRIEALRQLVNEAVQGRIEFDAEFAKRTLMEVISRERRTGKFRSFVSFATLPLNLLDFVSPLPGVGTAAQIATDHAIGGLGEKRLKADYQWFYLLHDVIRAGS